MKIGKMLKMLPVALLATLVACGGDEDDSTNVIVNPDADQQQEEEGPISSGPTVIVNNTIVNNVRVTNRRTRVENNEFIMNWECGNLDPVVHHQYIHVGVSCPTQADDLNRDGIVDQVEVQQAIGPGVIALDSNIGSGQEEGFPTGSNYVYSQSVSLSQLRQSVPPGQDFVVMFYGVEASTQLPATASTTWDDPLHLTVPVACKVFRAPETTDTDETGTTTGGTGTGTTTGGTGTGTTTGGSGTGTTTGGTDTGTTTGGTGTGTTTGGTGTGTTTGGTGTGTTTGGTGTGTTTGSDTTTTGTDTTTGTETTTTTGTETTTTGI